ncbi:MAG TPA: glycosyltransferase [Phycisphaerae bacterium]|nr:glycosyltransferase [Phycisphaerae bacterium]
MGSTHRRRGLHFVEANHSLWAMADRETKARQRRVLILTASLGAGHKAAAGALAHALQAAKPAPELRIIDALDYAHRFFRFYYAGLFVAGMTRLSRLWGWGFDLADGPHVPGRTNLEKLRLWTERRALRRLAEEVTAWRPDVVLNTHFVSAPLVGRLIAHGSLQAVHMVVGTDHNMHRWWFAENVDQWFMPDEASRARARRWGVPNDRIAVTGIPIHPKWTQRLDRRKVCADWSLPAETPIVIVTGGTEFTCGPVVALAVGILRACPRSHVVVLAGRNKRLLAELSRLEAAGRRLSPVSFTDRVHELVEVASLIVTKPGGITTAECCAKGTPMVLLPPVPGQEAANARHLCEHGAAVTPGGPAKVVGAVQRLLDNPGELARMSDCARGLYRPATSTIVGAICRAL